MDTEDVGKIPGLYIWIRENLLTFISVTLLLIFIYTVYSFIGGWATHFGASFDIERKALKQTIATYPELDAIITKEMVAYKASRVLIDRFHDSARDVSKMAYFFTTVTNIVARPGVSVDINEISNIPLANFTQVLPTLLSGKPVLIHVNELNQGALRELFIKRGVQVAVLVPISNLNDDLIGFIALSWLNDKDVPEDTQNMFRQLQDDASRVSGYVSEPPK